MRMPAHKSTISSCLFLFAAAGLAAGGCNAMNGRMMNQAGTAYYNQGNYAMAQQEFQRAVADRPHDPNYRHNLAMALHKQGRIVEAEQVYRQTLQMDPNHQPTYHGLATLLKDNGRQTEAANMLAGWATSQPRNPEAHIEMAWLNREMGDYIGAEQSLKQAIAVEPEHAGAMAQLGDVYQQTGRTQEARTAYRRSLDVNWLQPKVHSRMARVDRQSFGSVPTNTMFTSGPLPATAQLPNYGSYSTGATPELADAPGNADPAHVDVERRQSPNFE